MKRCNYCGNYLPWEKRILLSPYYNIKCPHCNEELRITKRSSTKISFRVAIIIFSFCILLQLISLMISVFLLLPLSILIIMSGVISIFIGAYLLLYYNDKYAEIIIDK